MNNRYMKYIVTIGIGLLMAYAVFSYKNLFEASDVSNIVIILSDGFLVPAVVLGGLGVLFFVSNGGMFDIFIYAGGLLSETFKRKVDRDPSFPRTYFDFKQQREKKIAVTHFLVIGSTFLLLSLVFNIIFYYV